MRKTPLMREVEYRIGMPLEKALPGLLAAQGLAATSRSLGVPDSTLSRWALRLKIRWPRGQGREKRAFPPAAKSG